MITIKPYIDFFKGLAEQHVGIRHSDTNKRFFRMNLHEITGDMRSKIDPDNKIMTLESYQHSSKDLHSDNHLRDYTGAFMILQRDKNTDDYNIQDTILDECEEIAIEISRKMYDDSINPDYDARFFVNLELGSFTFQKVGPIFGSWYGFRCQFDFDDNYKIAIDPTKWDDIVDPPVIPVEGQFSMIVNINGSEVYNQVWESQDSNIINIT
jgi:hypothetical protein